MDKIKNILNWLKKGWYGALVAYLLSLILVLGGIWIIVEPMGVPDEFISLPNFTKFRFFWHFLLAVFITSHLIIILLAYLLNFFKENSAQKYNIKIHQPKDSDDIESPFRISGSYEVKPPDGSLRILEYSPKSSDYWIKNEVIFEESKKHWFVENVYICGEHGDKREISVAYFGENGKILAIYYEKVNEGLRSLIGMKKLSKDIQICDKVNIRRRRL